MVFSLSAMIASWFVRVVSDKRDVILNEVSGMIVDKRPSTTYLMMMIDRDLFPLQQSLSHVSTLERDTDITSFFRVRHQLDVRSTWIGSGHGSICMVSCESEVCGG